MPITDDKLVEEMGVEFEQLYHKATLSCGTTLHNLHESMRSALAYARPIIEREARDKVLDQAVKAVANAWQNTAYFHAEAMIAACNAILALKDAPHD